MRPALKLTLAVAVAIAVAVTAAVVVLGDPRGWWMADHHDELAGLTPQPGPSAEAEDESSPPRDALDVNSSTVLTEAEDTWTPIFAEESDTYIPPRLRYFDGTTRSGCGDAVVGDGTFYCAPDRRLYIDKDFHHGMEERGAPAGSLAHAYVIAHSIGHHVQNLRGIEDRVRRLEATLGASDRKALRVRTELQADCFAGIWAHSARSGKAAIKPAELEQALSLPASIGIELVKRHEPGVIVPDTFAHASLAQRRYWFKTGYKTGLVKACDSFTAPAPP